MDTEKIALVFLSIMVCVVLIFSVFSFFPERQAEKYPTMSQRKSAMALTEFDKSAGRAIMDKDNDGKCDACGMPVEMCLDGGEIQCSMDPTATIGELGSQHIHADWKIFVNGQPFDWSPYGSRHERQMQGDSSIKDTSAFIHIHPAEASEKAGDILHIHATGVPLSMFFESLGMKFTRDCLESSLQENAPLEKYCTDATNSLKFYVNGKPNDQYADYVLHDLDKILISYGPKNEDVSTQLTTITNFTGNH